MIKYNEVNLATKTTLRMGGVCKSYYIPENEDELLQLLHKLYIEEGHIKVISGGSNLCINDQVCFSSVVDMHKAESVFFYEGDGRFYLGSSLKMNDAIKRINDFGFGGIEQMSSIPGLIGGGIYGNAGIGSKQNQKVNLGDYIEYVKAFDPEANCIRELKKEECLFDYRQSVFQDNNLIILGAMFKFQKVNKEDAEKRRKERLQFAKNNHEWGKGCIGTVFSEDDPFLLSIVKRIKPVWGGLHISNNSANWVVNTNGTAKYKDIQNYINMCTIIHKIAHKTIKLEICMWDN